MRGSVCDLGPKGVCVLFDDGERRWDSMLKEGDNCVVEAPNLDVFLSKFYSSGNDPPSKPLGSGVEDFQTVLARKRAALAEQIAALRAPPNSEALEPEAEGGKVTQVLPQMPMNKRVKVEGPGFYNACTNLAPEVLEFITPSVQLC